ncbi:hypothetical protein GGU11DRAFT_867061 [Lentinula aff. detonsa]|nr:hypothetical protein GGU11DRAFT_867061 [Lentinula aff. detonsa]
MLDNSFSVIHPTPHPHAQHAMPDTLRPTHKTTMPTHATPNPQNESALDSFAVVHPTPHPHAGQKTSPLDSFSVVHPTPHPHAQQTLHPTAFTLCPTQHARHTLHPTHKTSPLWTHLRSFTLHPTHTPNPQNESALDSFSPYAPPTRRTENESFSVVHPTPHPHAQHAMLTCYARPTKRVRFGLICGRSPYAPPTRRTENESALDSFSVIHPTPNPHAQQMLHPTAFTLCPTQHAQHMLRPTHKTSPLWTSLQLFTHSTPHPLARQHTRAIRLCN